MSNSRKGQEQMKALWLFYTQKYLPDIAQCRKVSGMTQQQLADAAGISRTALISYEANFSSPSLDVMSRIAAILGVGIEDLTRLNPDKDMSFEDFEKNIHNADMFIIVDDTGNRLREARLHAGLSIPEFAALVKMSSQAITVIEEGSSSGLTRDKALRICRALDKEVNEIFNQQ